MMRYMHALLLIGGANTYQMDTLIRRHAAPPQPTSASSTAASPDAAEPMVSAPAWLPAEIFYSAGRGELQKVVKWLDKRLSTGRSTDALYSIPTPDGQTAAIALLHVAATNGDVGMVRELLKRGASVDLQSSLLGLTCSEISGHGCTGDLYPVGGTPLMDAAYGGHLSVVLALLQYSASPDLQDIDGNTALTLAASRGQEACVQVLLQRKANTKLLDGDGRTALWWAEAHGHTATAELIRQHAARSTQPAAASSTAVSSPASLPVEVFVSAEKGELQRVVKWLRKGGPVDALCSTTTADGVKSTFALLHAAADKGHLEMVRELLKRGARIDLPDSFSSTTLMIAARHGHLSIMLVLLQHSANPDLQNIHGLTALMSAAAVGHEACVQALLRAKANTELLDIQGRTAVQWAEMKGYAAVAELLRKQVSGIGVTVCAVPWVMLSALLGAIATVAIRRTLTARPSQNRAARQRPHRSARHAKGRTTTEEPMTRQHAAPPQPVAAVALHTLQAEQVRAQARADGAMEEPLVEEEAEQSPSKESKKKKKKAGGAATAGDESSEAPPTAAPALPFAAAPKPDASAAERAEAALRAAIAGGGLSALEAALAAAPREVRAGNVVAEAHVWRDSLLEAQLEAEREAKQEAAAEAARLATAERVREVAARAAAASEAREEVVAAATKADALEQVMAADAGERGSSRAADPSETSEAGEVYVCPITAEIMTDPVSTMDGFTYERTAISEWLHTNDTSPSTGVTLESKALVPNCSLRSMIRSFAEEFDAGEFARVYNCRR